MVREADTSVGDEFAREHSGKKGENLAQTKGISRRSASDITLVSTHTVDHVPLADGRVVRLPGGPAHYIGGVLAHLGRSFTLITGEVVEVEVVLGTGGEEYVIPSMPAISLPPRLEGGAIILSPIAGEIEPHWIPPVDGMLVVDLQGFVRHPGVRTDQPGRTYELAELLSRAHVVKASPSELDRLTQKSRQALQHALLIVTHGVAGADICDGDRHTHIEARPVRATNTIGAGDTFLAALVHYLLSDETPEVAATAAARFTEHVLSERRPHPRERSSISMDFPP